jgi:phosphoribosylglycinamide formyltransferase-1
MQGEVEVTANDTAQTLEAKVHAVEYELYPRAIHKLLLSIEN